MPTHPRPELNCRCSWCALPECPLRLQNDLGNGAPPCFEEFVPSDVRRVETELHEQIFSLRRADAAERKRRRAAENENVNENKRCKLETEAARRAYQYKARYGSNVPAYVHGPSIDWLRAHPMHFAEIDISSNHKSEWADRPPRHPGETVRLKELELRLCLDLLLPLVDKEKALWRRNKLCELRHGQLVAQRKAAAKRAGDAMDEVIEARRVAYEHGQPN